MHLATHPRAWRRSWPNYVSLRRDGLQRTEDRPGDRTKSMANSIQLFYSDVQRTPRLSTPYCLKMLLRMFVDLQLFTLSG
jgi:hypothetical protein